MAVLSVNKNGIISLENYNNYSQEGFKEGLAKVGKILLTPILLLKKLIIAIINFFKKIINYFVNLKNKNKKNKENEKSPFNLLYLKMKRLCYNVKEMKIGGYDSLFLIEEPLNDGNVEENLKEFFTSIGKTDFATDTSPSKERDLELIRKVETYKQIFKDKIIVKSKEIQAIKEKENGVYIESLLAMSKKENLKLEKEEEDLIIDLEQVILNLQISSREMYKVEIDDIIDYDKIIKIYDSAYDYLETGHKSLELIVNKLTEYVKRNIEFIYVEEILNIIKRANSYTGYILDYIMKTTGMLREALDYAHITFQRQEQEV